MTPNELLEQAAELMRQQRDEALAACERLRAQNARLQAVVDAVLEERAARRARCAASVHDYGQDGFCEVIARRETAERTLNEALAALEGT